MTQTTETKGIEKGEVEGQSDAAQDRCIYGVTRAVDLDARTADGVASTIQVDRDGEIILPSAIEAHLAEFKGGHRPLLSQHTHRTSTASAAMAGWVKEIRVDRIEVPCTFLFGRSDAGEDWWKLASDPAGFGIAFSIGFIPIRWARGSVADLVRAFPEIADAVRAAGLADDDQLLLWTEIELLEVSCVGVPSNRGCVERAAELLAKGRRGAGEIISALVAKDAAREEFVKAIGAEVITRLAEFDLPAKLIEGAQSKLDVILDRLSEAVELIRLSSETLGVANPVPEGPAAGDKGRRDGDSEGARQLRQAAARLKSAAGGQPVNRLTG